MNNPQNNQNQKIEGVFGSEKEADNFIDQMKKSYNVLPTSDKILYGKRQATEDVKTINGNIKKTDWIVTIEGQKKDIDDIRTKIAEHGGFCL